MCEKKVVVHILGQKPKHLQNILILCNCFSVMYLVANLILVCVSIAINVFLENVYYDSQNKHPPELIRKVRVFLTIGARGI